MKTREDKIHDFLRSLRIDMDITNFVELGDINSFQDIIDQLYDKGAFSQEGEIIYYSNAINFLRENDPSLRESFGIVNDFGFSLDNLNSETLASLLKERMLIDEFNELENEINDFFEELEEEESED